ncbi:MAG: Fic family protein [Gemmatimonadetes bacterium]|nr:Fic family protein [Gemmatimonadota bacterium]
MHPYEFEPLLPDAGAYGLADLALEFEREAARLESGLHPDVRAEIVDLLRVANSYYSNRIEGNDTTLAGIEAAVRGEWASDPRVRSLQRLTLAHVEIEREADRWLDDDARRNPLSPDTLRALHRAFYEDVEPSERWVVAPGSGRREPIEPGALRTFDVILGRHVAPPHADVPAFLARAAEVYDPAGLTGLDRAIAFAASHHRLLWVHPFGDGNGRVVRLASRLAARALGIRATGLWTPARGLSRQRERYMAALAEADLPRRNDLDGRGALSAEGLAAFTRFFLACCLDQVRYMHDVLSLDALGPRIRDWVARRDAGVLPGRDAPLPSGATALLNHCLREGRTRRGDVATIIGRSPRTSTTLVAALLDEGLLLSDSPKGTVRLGFPLPVLRDWLPGLYPEGYDQWAPSAPATTSP